MASRLAALSLSLVATAQRSMGRQEAVATLSCVVAMRRADIAVVPTAAPFALLAALQSLDQAAPSTSHRARQLELTQPRAPFALRPLLFRQQAAARAT
jgi:hypothetical protein